MKNFAFYVSSNAGRLKSFLLKYKEDSILNGIKFILIDNKNNKELRTICKELKISLFEVDLLLEENKNTFISNLFFEYLRRYNIDYGFIFADRILVGELLLEYKNKLINFHPAILPSHKGLYAIDKALKENTFLLGNTAHIVTKELDAGCVIMQNIFPAINFINYDEVLDKQLIMILQLMHWINNNRLIINNNKAIIKDASYSVKEYIPNIEINWTMNKKQ